MKNKCKLLNKIIVTAVVASAFFLFGCAKEVVREDIQPRYVFPIDESVSYEAEITMDLTVEAGFISFSGEVGLELDISLKAVETNQYGYKLQVSLANPNVIGANSQISTLAIQALNFVRNYLSVIYITPEGKLTVFYNNTNHAGLESYASLIFPDFSRMDELWNKVKISTNFAMKNEDMRLIETFKMESSVNQVSYPDMKVGHKVDIGLYELEDYYKSVDPIELGTLEMEYTDVFDYELGRLDKKTGYLFLEGNMMISQGIFALNVSLRGTGSFSMKRVDEEIS